MPIDKKTKLSIQKIRYVIGIVHCSTGKNIYYLISMYILSM